ncbi:nucleotidyltransferase domain protein [Leptospira ellinghausenii]|uniref:Nucleotidyltransferase domain protein n=1 Tax=Leptospira ellinghausenii TaxID=1917822 RepID=A0A2P2DH53_9LEPT|nr:nucleotidyltransferase family protein [Leptospira ellinghausenii]GBF43964.1 nucleotidyltransferase domain protein [Leptospira ellinghausenii]
MFPLSKNQILTQLKDDKAILSHFGVAQIGLFGSFVRDESNENSDIDILVEFLPEQKTFRNYMDLKIYLEDSFHRKIDLVIKDSLKVRIKDQILSEAVYAA